MEILEKCSPGHLESLRYLNQIHDALRTVLLRRELPEILFGHNRLWLGDFFLLPFSDRND